MTAARRQPGELMRRHRGARAVATHNREPRRKAPMALALGADTWSAAVTSAEARTSFNADAAPDTQKPLHGRANNAGVATGSRKRPASERVTVGRRLRLHHASPTHEPRHAANYGDGWHPLNAPRLKPEARSPLPPCAKGRQDTQAGSTQCRMTP